MVAPGSGARDARSSTPRPRSRSPRSRRGGHDLAAAFALRARPRRRASSRALTFAAARRAARGARQGDPRRARGADRARGRQRRQHARRREVRHRRRRGHARRTTPSSARKLGDAPAARRRRADPGRPHRAHGRPARVGARGRGVAVHINAFNFPAWGLCEKLACALLAGMPVISKPATATALVAHRLVELFEPLLPPGALQMLVGPAGDAARSPRRPATSSRSPAAARPRAMLRAHAKMVAHGVRLNIEADSAQRRGARRPTSSSASETGELFLADVVRDMTQKTGQKCTAIRRVLVPGRQARRRVRRAARAARRRSRSAIRRARTSAWARSRPRRSATTSAPASRGSPRRPRRSTAAPARSRRSACPPARASSSARSCARRSDADGLRAAQRARGVRPGVDGRAATPATRAFAAAFVARGEGCLVSSAYSDDRDWVASFVGAAAPWAGRLYLGSAKMAAQSPGPGHRAAVAAPRRPGPRRRRRGARRRARGPALYQRCALEGDASVLKALVSG